VTASADPVLLEVSAAVATVTLNRPDSANALTAAAKQALLEALARVADDPTVRCVLVTGAGRAFCAGQDLAEHAEVLASGGGGAAIDVATDAYNRIVLLLATMPKPVVAAVNGACAGAGLGVALACDLRLAAAGARFATAFAGVGLAADSGVSWTLPRTVGTSTAMSMLILGRRLSADDALAAGLVAEVVPDAALATRAAEVGAALAAGPTAAFAAIKTQLATSSVTNLEDALAVEARLQAQVGATADHRGAVAAFLAKQTPTFEGR
jgi:2-(1,2-epoxy-1,2-dihydrophenyl)acetyl-CoA isomerase